MAKRINFWELPIEDAQPDDTVPAYRGRGQVARVRMADVGGDGTVTSVGVSMPAGFQVANSPITSSGTITVTFAAGYGLPTTAKMGEWSTAYSWGDHAQAGYALASAVTSALAGKVDKVAGKGLSTEDYTTAEKSKLAGIQAGATANATDAQLRDRATHTGTQPASTITGLATVATTGSYNDLTGKPSIPAGTVTSVGLSAPTGFSVSGSPVTGSGTLALTFASGYSLPTTAKQGQWDQAYGWGNHASAGYVTTAAMQAYTYDKATIDSKIDAGGGEETYPYRGNLGTSNLNDVREPGLWGQAVHADATLARNYPFEGVPGALEVLTLNPDTTPFAIVTQRYTTNEGNQRIAIRRGGAQGGWNAWKEIPFDGGGTAPGFESGPVPPTSPLGGLRWFDTTSGIEYTWLDSGAGQWVEMGPTERIPEDITIVDFETSNPFTLGDSTYFSRSSQAAKTGNFGLMADGQTAYRIIYDGTRIIGSSRRFKMAGWLRCDDKGGHMYKAPSLCFGLEGGGSLNGYFVHLDGRNNLTIRRDFGTSAGANNTKGTYSIQMDVWYWVEVTWVDGQILAYLYDDQPANGGVLLDLVARVDDTYTSGYLGLGCYSEASFDDLRISV